MDDDDIIPITTTQNSCVILLVVIVVVVVIDLIFRLYVSFDVLVFSKVCFLRTHESVDVEESISRRRPVDGSAVSPPGVRDRTDTNGKLFTRKIVVLKPASAWHSNICDKVRLSDIST